MAAAAQAPPLYEIRATASKGLGVFASRDIPAGTRITSETAILTAKRNPGIIDPLTIYEAFESLSSLQQEEYLKLFPASKQTDFALQCMDDDIPLEIRSHVAKVASIFESNAFRMGSEGRQNIDDEHMAGIFPIAARFNHSCIPNVAQTFNDVKGTMTLHSVRNIDTGEELCEGYISLTDDRETRQKKLAAYGFVCSCEACDTSSEIGNIRAKRRDQIRKLEQSLSLFTNQTEGQKGRTQASKSNILVNGQDSTLTVVEELERLLREEGLVGHDLLRWYDYAAWDSATHQSQDLTKVIEWQKKAFMLDLQIKGGDHQDTDRARKRLTDLTRKSLAKKKELSA